MLNALGIDSNAHLKTLSKGTKEKVQLILVMNGKHQCHSRIYLNRFIILGIDVIFMKNGSLMLYTSVDSIRSQMGKSVDTYFREVYAC